MSANLRIVRHEDFRKTVETLLGGPISNDVAIVSKDSLSQKVSAIDLSVFINKMVQLGVKSQDVAVITQEALIQQEQSNNISSEAIKGVKRKLGK